LGLACSERNRTNQSPDTAELNEVYTRLLVTVKNIDIGKNVYFSLVFSSLCLTDTCTQYANNFFYL